MNIRKYLAIFLVTVMALTVLSTAGVLAAPKAAAAPKTQGPIEITYEQGKTVTITSKQLNYVTTQTLVGQEGETPNLKAFAKGSTASTLVQTTKPVSMASAYVRVGADIIVKGAPSGTVPVTITFNGRYTENAVGSSYSYVWTWDKEHVIYGGDIPRAKTGVFSGSSRGDLSSFFWIPGNDAKTYTGQIYCDAMSFVSGVGLTDTTLSVSSIVITFN